MNNTDQTPRFTDADLARVLGIKLADPCAIVRRAFAHILFPPRSDESEDAPVPAS